MTEAEQIEELWKDGMTDRYIAKFLKIAPYKVAKIRRYNGWIRVECYSSSELNSRAKMIASAKGVL